jgi:GTP-binding protein
VEDIRAINAELASFNPDIMKKPMLIAANKIDVTEALEEDPVEKIKAAFEGEGFSVFPISAATGEGVRELLYEVRKLLATTAPKQVYYEQEYYPEDEISSADLPYTIEVEEDRDGSLQFVVEGPKIDRMLSYTNLDSEKGFRYFTQFLRRSGIIAELKKRGITDGTSVRMYGHVFEFYDDEVGE